MLGCLGLNMCGGIHDVQSGKEMDKGGSLTLIKNCCMNVKKLNKNKKNRKSTNDLMIQHKNLENQVQTNKMRKK